MVEESAGGWRGRKVGARSRGPSAGRGGPTCPAGSYATGGGAYDLNTSTGSVSDFLGGWRPIGSPPTGYQSQLSSNTGSNESTVVFAICRP